MTRWSRDSITNKRYPYIRQEIMTDLMEVKIAASEQISTYARKTTEHKITSLYSEMIPELKQEHLAGL